MRVQIRRFSPMWILSMQKYDMRCTIPDALRPVGSSERVEAHRRHLELALHPSSMRVSYFTMPAISVDRDVDFVTADLRRQKKIAVSMRAIESCQLFSHKFRSTSRRFKW